MKLSSEKGTVPITHNDSPSRIELILFWLAALILHFCHHALSLQAASVTKDMELVKTLVGEVLVNEASFTTR